METHMARTLTKRQANLAALLCQIAFVDEIAKAPAKRDPQFKAISQGEIYALIDALQAISK